MKLQDIAIFLLLLSTWILANAIENNEDRINQMQTEITQLKQACSVYEPAPILNTEGE